MKNLNANEYISNQFLMAYYGKVVLELLKKTFFFVADDISMEWMRKFIVIIFFLNQVESMNLGKFPETFLLANLIVFHRTCDRPRIFILTKNKKLFDDIQFWVQFNIIFFVIDTDEAIYTILHFFCHAHGTFAFFSCLFSNYM